MNMRLFAAISFILVPFVIFVIPLTCSIIKEGKKIELIYLFRVIGIILTIPGLGFFALLGNTKYIFLFFIIMTIGAILVIIGTILEEKYL